MNQILISEKLYITPELKKKKNMYKIDFFISIFLICILFSYYIYAEYDKNKNEEMSQEILSSMTFEDDLVDDTTIKFADNSVVVILNAEDPFEVIYSEPVEAEVTEEPVERNIRKTASGQEYWTIASIDIPSIDVHYPILNTTTDELLKISPTKFHGPDPNEVGNFCIVGHNYRNKKFFSKVPLLEDGDIIQITDMKGITLDYEVYDKYVVDPTDVACTSQRTNGMKEITLITCTNDSKHRVIIKAREV
ncbi:MAG: sortase [Clostridia bacterium]|jgi:LPXTG-site transpeptidase (sortase) family protein|nr:sortase [Clostridia bacterium]